MDTLIALADFNGMDHDAVKAKIADDFEIKGGLAADVEILVAYMSVGDYGCDSDAFIVFRQDGKLFEVNGSHCSCYGFETQWEPEQVEDIAVILQREDYSLAGGGYDDDQAKNAAAIRAHLTKLFPVGGEL